VDKLAGFRRLGGRLLTVDRVIVRAADKAELRRECSADLLDLESFAVALAAREKAIRFFGVRVISDDACEELPPEVARLLSHSGSYQIGAAMRAIWDRPSALKDFWALHARAQEAADRLARGIAKLVEVLPGF
jgi:adenosylhomocysteine nucleosidase